MTLLSFNPKLRHKLNHKIDSRPAKRRRTDPLITLGSILDKVGAIQIYELDLHSPLRSVDTKHNILACTTEYVK
jgi:hypothetical protein